MPETPARAGWLLPVLLAVTTSAALGLGYLYLARPNAGELGSIRVVVAEDGKGAAANGITVVVAEAPFVQKETVSPGQKFGDVVHFPQPYRITPHLKLTASGKRSYEVAAVTETGFTWIARPQPDDFKEDVRKDAGLVETFLGHNLSLAQSQGKLKPGIVFEDFTWEAKGVRMPPSAIPVPPPKPFEQKGNFMSLYGQEAVVHFPVPYDSAPSVEFGGGPAAGNTLMVEATPTGFKWRNTSKEGGRGWEGSLTWTARGVRGEKK
jgi:hypothetical protein